MRPLADSIPIPIGSASATTLQTPGDALDPYLPLPALAAYSGLSVRSLRRAMANRVHPLPHYRPGGGKILVRRSEFDRWMRQFREAPTQVDLDRLIETTLREVQP
jgi:hypothetical protein